MQDKIGNSSLSIARSSNHRHLGILIGLATATLVVHVLLGDRYGFHRDELATLNDARHLAWGYVAYPPVTPFFCRASLELFGTSLTGFRFFAALVDALSVVIAGLMACELGGGRYAQLLTALTVVPFCLGAGTLMEYVSFDYFFWILTAYFVARLLRSDDPRWWIGVGCSIGLGMLTKYSILICVAGLVVGVALTKLRRHLRSKWLWIGVACSLLIFLPNLSWQLRHDFISLDFLRHIHARDVQIGRTKNFLSDQLLLTLFALPVAVAGLYLYFFTVNGRRFQVLGWMYLIPLVLFFVLKGRGYYLKPAYPVLFADGSTWMEQSLAKISRTWMRSTVWTALWLGMGANILVTAAFWFPLAPINSNWWSKAVKVNGDFREEVGWPELVESIARIHDSLPPNERARVGILAGNYGEAGAINLYGSRYGLPTAMSSINSFWQRCTAIHRRKL